MKQARGISVGSRSARSTRRLRARAPPHPRRSACPEPRIGELALDRKIGDLPTAQLLRTSTRKGLQKPMSEPRAQGSARHRRLSPTERGRQQVLVSSSPPWTPSRRGLRQFDGARGDRVLGSALKGTQWTCVVLRPLECHPTPVGAPVGRMTCPRPPGYEIEGRGCAGLLVACSSGATCGVLPTVAPRLMPGLMPAAGAGGAEHQGHHGEQRRCDSVESRDKPAVTKSGTRCMSCQGRRGHRPRQWWNGRHFHRHQTGPRGSPYFRFAASLVCRDRRSDSSPASGSSTSSRGS